MLKGSIVALITPFINNEVDYNKLGELIDFQIANKTNGVLLLGTTAESSTLNNEEKNKIILFSKNKIKDKMDILVGICTNNTKKAILECAGYEKIGIKNFLVISPYYNKSNYEGLYNHFKEIALSTTSNIIIYNIPNRTGVNLEYSLIEKLSLIKNITGIKEANENFKDSIKLFSLQSNTFNIYCGNDEFIIPFMSLGAKGFINVVGNIIPNQYSNIYKFCLNNDFNSALNIFNTYRDVILNVFLETNPIGIKEAMNILNISDNSFRLPLYKMSHVNSIQLKKEIMNIGEYFNYKV